MLSRILGLAAGAGGVVGAGAGGVVGAAGAFVGGTAVGGTGVGVGAGPPQAVNNNPAMTSRISARFMVNPP